MAFFSILLLLFLKEVIGDVPQDFDCPMRQLLLEFAAEIQPNLSQDQLNEISDALNGAPEAQNCSVSPKFLSNKPQHIHRQPKIWEDLQNDDIDIFCN